MLRCLAGAPAAVRWRRSLGGDGRYLETAQEEPQRYSEGVLGAEGVKGMWGDRARPRDPETH